MIVDIYQLQSRRAQRLCTPLPRFSEFRLFGGGGGLEAISTLGLTAYVHIYWPSISSLGFGKSLSYSEGTPAPSSRFNVGGHAHARSVAGFGRKIKMSVRTPATIFDIPLYDILFPHVFCYLDAWEVWKIRTVSTSFCRICWTYFSSALTTLCVDLTCESEENDIASVSSKLVAAIEITRICRPLKRFAVHLTSFTCTSVLGKRDVEGLLMTVAGTSPQLEMLHISGLKSVQFSPSVAKRLGQCCNQLTELALWNVDPDGIIFDSIFSCILDQPILTLNKLSLKSIKFYERDTLCKSAIKFPNLRNFTVKN